MKYIDAEKLKAEIEFAKSVYDNPKRVIHGVADAFRQDGRAAMCDDILKKIASLQQEQCETDMKSPFTGGKVVILSREEEVTFRGEKIKVTRKYYRCVDTGREFTDSKLDDDMMWAAFRAYCEKKGMTSFTDIMLKQEQPNNMIQWTGNNLKEVIDFTGKSPKFGEWFSSWEEYENYVHAHNNILKLFCEDGSHYEVPVGAWIVKTPDGYNVPSVARFIYTKQESSEVDLEKEVVSFCFDNGINISPRQAKNIASHFYELGRLSNK